MNAAERLTESDRRRKSLQWGRNVSIPEMEAGRSDIISEAGLQ